MPSKEPLHEGFRATDPVLTALIVRWRTMPTRPVKSDLPNIAASLPRPGRSCRRAAAAGRSQMATILAEFCRAQGRKAEALRRAEEGLWMFEDERTDDRLLSFVVDGLAKDGRTKDAEAHLWRVYEKGPTLDLHGRLQELGGKSACERALAFLEAKVLKEKATRGRDWG